MFVDFKFWLKFRLFRFQKKSKLGNFVEPCACVDQRCKNTETETKISKTIIYRMKYTLADIINDNIVFAKVTSGKILCFYSD